MASATDSSSLTRFRPFVLTICGAAAAFSIYQVYKAYQPPPGPGLRRRHAVHRRRHRRESRSASPSPAVVDSRVPQPEIPLEDVETVAETHISASGHTVADGPGGGHSELTELLYHIGENRAREAGYIHRGVTCDSCGTVPIQGIRWHCMQCEDFDLCSECEAQGLHDRTHIFGKIKIPAPALVGSVKLTQPVIYTGYPGSLPPSLPTDVRRKLHQHTTLEIEVLDALYDQFSCLTTTHDWRDDPSGIGSGIDRAGFDKGFFASYLNTPRHNLVYDRYFSFFDIEKDGVIDFVEYATAIAIHTNLKGRNAKLKAVFDGYDIDEDGFVCRKDFLRMLRSYFTLQRLIVQDALEHEEGLSLKLMEGHLASAQPLGAVFKTSYHHRGNHDRLPEEKISGEDGVSAWRDPILSEDRPDEEENRWEAVNGQSHASPSELKRRWQRRRFYSDEEEGVLPPPGWTQPDGTDDADEAPEPAVASVKPSSALRQTPEGSRPASSRSRSSSKVRFKAADIRDADLRSNASSSSRPIGERWGGYEIPPEERDVGSDILFQVTQEALNELLDPLFAAKETQAEQVNETKSERAKWADQIRAYQEQHKKADAASNDPLLATATAVQGQNGTVNVPANGMPTAPTPPAIPTIETVNEPAPIDGAQDAVAEVADSLRRLPTNHVAEQIAAVERQVEDASIDQLLSDSGYSIGISRTPTFVEFSEPIALTTSSTLPQLRPSTPELERLESRARNALHRVPSPPSPLFLPEEDDLHPVLRVPQAQRFEQEPDEARLQFYMYLDACEREINARGGEGRISWEEFRAALADEEEEGRFGFLEDWIRIGQI